MPGFRTLIVIILSSTLPLPALDAQLNLFGGFGSAETYSAGVGIGISSIVPSPLPLFSKGYIGARFIQHFSDKLSLDTDDGIRIDSQTVVAGLEFGPVIFGSNSLYIMPVWIIGVARFSTEAGTEAVAAATVNEFLFSPGIAGVGSFGRFHLGAEGRYYFAGEEGSFAFYGRVGISL